MNQVTSTWPNHHSEMPLKKRVHRWANFEFELYFGFRYENSDILPVTTQFRPSPGVGKFSITTLVSIHFMRQMVRQGRMMDLLCDQAVKAYMAKQVNVKVDIGA